MWPRYFRLLPNLARTTGFKSYSMSVPTGEAYLETVKDGIAAISLNRPKAKNAISVQLLKELRASIDAAAQDSSYVHLPWGEEQQDVI